MAPLSVNIKHAGKTYKVDLDPELPPVAFKDAVYQVTGVPIDRMKVMLKGGVLKDDTDWKKVAPKAGQTFTVIGAAGELPKPPAKATVFIEDMDDSELAEALAKPVGIRNLGNTCYMNASVQALRAIPELQVALSAPALQSPTPLPAALRDLYSSMSKTTDAVTPMAFLSVLRQVNPQFAELDRSGKGGAAGGMRGYAQQDAEECYGQIIQSLGNVPGLTEEGTVVPQSSSGIATGPKFVDQWLMGRLRRELKCAEAPDEPPSIALENVLKIECNITVSTNFMAAGIMNSLDTTLTKRSPTLGRDALYTQTSRLTRLPGYLTVHMVRFAWREDINKKAKIMRRVKFPTEFDALDIAVPELKEKLLPVSRRLKEFEKERAERRKVRKRTKVAPTKVAPTAPSGGDVEMADAATDMAVASGSAAGSGVEEQAKVSEAGGELEPEQVYRSKELAELEALVPAEVKKDIGSSLSGLYDLVAIVTHKGAAADAGHYIGFAKKSVFHPAKHAVTEDNEASGSGPAPFELDDDDDDWYKFDDDKVSVFPKEKLSTLDGGGEDSSAYVLLYKSKALA